MLIQSISFGNIKKYIHIFQGGESDVERNPLLILNKLRPGVQYELIHEFGEAPNIMFTFSCRVDNQTFEGTGMEIQCTVI